MGRNSDRFQGKDRTDASRCPVGATAFPSPTWRRFVSLSSQTIWTLVCVIPTGGVGGRTRSFASFPLGPPSTVQPESPSYHSGLASSQEGQGPKSSALVSSDLASICPPHLHILIPACLV